MAENKQRGDVAALVSPTRMTELLQPYYPDPPCSLIESLGVYLELLLRWNARTNLTSIREPEAIVTRHFGESLFLAAHLPHCANALDLGSGAGFPGIPVQLAMPGLQVTLAESQNKKAAFLQEAVRNLELPTVVWARRVELMPLSTRFDVVMLRAVDHPVQVLALAEARVVPTGWIAHLTSSATDDVDLLPLPNRSKSGLRLFRPNVPRGTPLPGSS